MEKPFCTQHLTPPRDIISFAESNPYLVLDTSLFPPDFQAQLLSELSDEQNLDASTDGLLIHADNFQALNLLQARYREQVKCIYIDPPYNTAASEIIYKNGYKHSSWMSLLENRVITSIALLSEQGLFSIAIDGLEFANLEILTKQIFGRENFINSLTIQHNPKGREKEFFADSHEYMIILSKDKNKTKTNRLLLSSDELDKKYPKKEGSNQYRELPLRRSGSEAQREDRPYMYFPFLINRETCTLSILPEKEYKQIYVNSIFNDNFLEELRNKYENNGFIFILPIRSNNSKGRWRWGYDSCIAGIDKGVLFAKIDNDNAVIYQKDYADNSVLPKSFWFGERYDASTKGTNLLKSIIPNTKQPPSKDGGFK